MTVSRRTALRHLRYAWCMVQRWASSIGYRGCIALWGMLGCGGATAEPDAPNSAHPVTGGSASNDTYVGVLGGLGNAGSTTANAGAGGTGVMDCSAVTCPLPKCSSTSEPVTLLDECCPRCVGIDPSCAEVACTNPQCPQGFEPAREPGACCDTCRATPFARGPVCGPITCLVASSCARGYTEAAVEWSCCPLCVPDPNFCRDNNDCVLAEATNECCPCPTSISTRRFLQVSCLSVMGKPVQPAESCASPSACDVACAECQTGNWPICSNGTCVTTWITD